MKLPFLILGSALLSPFALRAQLGDRYETDPERPLPAALHAVPAPALSVGEELRTFRLAPGFRIEPVAAEPLVHDPVAAAYDLEGNLWVVEFNNFNAAMIQNLPALTMGTRASDIPSCRVVRLESSRHDGHFDRRIVWLEGLNEAKGIAIVHGGVLISDPPNLWLARDLHGTGHCDDKTLVADNYEAWSDPEESGSLLWGRDNVIHDIDFSYDYRYRNGTAERIPVAVRGQFGIAQDDFGRLYSCRSTDQLRCDLYGPAYGVRSGNVPEIPWADVQIAKDEEVWPSHPNITNRGYRVGIVGKHIDGVRADGTLLEFTAACSPQIYRGANFPADFYGNAFVPEPAGNLIKRDILVESKGRIDAVNAYTGTEFLTSTDSRFRPVALVNAPDGSLLVVDMYRGVLEEYHYTTTYLMKQSLARGLENPMFGLGRLWRITHEGGPLEKRQPDLGRMSAKGLVGLLESPNSWWRDTAQQELVERGDLSAVPGLEDLAGRAPASVTRLCALWTLDGLEATRPELLKQALADPSPKVRAAAVRVHERWLGGANADAMVGQLSSVLNDPEPEVLVQLALTLGQARTPASMEAMSRLLLAAGDDPFVPKALATGLGGRELAFFQLLEGRLDRIGFQPQVVSMLTILSTAIVRQGDRDQMHQLIASIGDGGGMPKWARMAALAGFDPLLTPAFRRSVGPTRLARSEELVSLAASSDSEIRAGAERLSTGLAKEEEQARIKAASARPLSAAERILYEQGRTTFQICAGCHQPTGAGMANVAPSLVDSHWVAGYPEALIRIVLCGKEGSPGFPGPMPPIGGTFSDAQIAGVLTYVRNSWDLHEGAVDAATVKGVRDEVGARQAAWTDAELRRVEGHVVLERARIAAQPRPGP